MSCAAAKTAPRSIVGKFLIYPSDNLQTLRADCGFHNVDRQVADMLQYDGAEPGKCRWQAISLEDRPDIIQAAIWQPEGHFGAKQLLAWEARAVHTAKPGIHRAVALGCSITNGAGGEPYFLTINRKNNGLVTIGLTSRRVLPLLDDTYYLRTW